MNTFPASPGTYLRQFDADGDYTDTPILAWQHISGNMAFPIFPVGNRSVGPGSLIYIPDGMWSHPSSGTVLEDWTDARAHVADFMEQHPAEPRMEKPLPKDVPVQPDGKPDLRPLHFGEQSYKTKSFWHWPTANVIFEIEGEQVYPSDPRVVKVKRDEWAKLKRDGASVIDPHHGVVQEPDEQDEQPEAEEDDFSDVV